MEELLGELLGLLLEPILEVLLEGVLALVAESIGELLAPVAETCSIPLIVGAGYLMTGAAIGFAASLDFPGRFTPQTPVFPGVSVVLAPLAIGLAMHLFGNWRRNHGGHPSRLATFWGGGLFGFGAALARFLMVGR